MKEVREEGIDHVVVEKGSLVHQNALDVLVKGRVVTKQLYAGFSQN